MPDNEKTNEVHLIADALPIAVCGKCGCEIDVEGIDAFAEVECPDCSNRVRVSARLGQFILTELIGTGGMGGVYYGQDETLGRRVAVKVMLKSLGDNEEFVASFKREAQAAARINHPNIVQIYSFGTERGQPYIVMELIDGLHFDKLIEEGQGKGIDETLVMQVALDIAEACNAASEQGLLHGDIKPENILLDEKLNAKLVDFGIASFANQSQEGIWGTPYYIAPEKLKRQKPDERSDMYSLGATLYHALAGHPPFEGKTPIEVVKARLDRNPKPLTMVNKKIHPNVATVVMRMIQQNPAMRHPTYISLLADLRKCVADLGGRRKSISAIKKTGKIRIANRTSPDVTGPDVIPLKPAYNKIVIQKGATSQERQAPAASTGQTKIIMRKKPSMVLSRPKPEAEGKARAATTPSAPPKPRSKAPLIILLVLFLLGGIGSTIGFLVHKHSAEIARRQEALRYEIATAALKTKYEEIHKISTNLAVAIAYNMRHVLAVNDAVFVVLGERMEVPAPKPKPPLKPVEETPAVINAPAAPVTNAPPVTSILPPGKTSSYYFHHGSPARSAMAVPATFPGISGSAFHAVCMVSSLPHFIPSVATASFQALKQSASQFAWNSMGRIPAILAAANDKGGSLRSKMGKNPKFPTRDDGPVSKDEKGREAPEGLGETKPTAEPDKPATKPAAEAPQPVPQAAPAPAPAPEKKPDPLAPQPSDPEIKKIAKKVLIDWVTLQEKAEQIREKEEEARVKVDEGRNSSNSAEANAIIPQVIEMLDWMKETEKEIKELALRMKENTAKVEELKERCLKDMEAKKRLEAAAEQALKDEETRKKKEEELKALAAVEVQLAIGTRDGIVPVIKHNRFAEALKTLEDQKKTMQTEDGKAAIQVFIDRAARLESLRLFLTEQINTIPFKWGWIQDGASTDIQTASDAGIKANNRVIPWTDVTVRQWLHLFKNYLHNELNTKKVGYKKLADQNLNAAIYCFENGGTDAAREYIGKALSVNEDIKPEAKRLLPNLVE